MSLENMKTVTEKVKWTLELKPHTRDDDRLLISAIYSDFYGITCETFMDVMKRKDLPGFESIRRSRQKVQEECEWLRGKKRTQDVRLAEQETYINYSQMTMTDLLEV